MSEIQGLGPTQPVRPAAPATRANLARPAVQTECPSSFGDDAVQVSTPAPQTRRPSVDPGASPARVQAAPAASSEVARVEEVDGFIVAGATQAPANTNRGTDVGCTFGSGPIAVIDEPAPSLVCPPEIWLNGPSTASAGLYTLTGLRLA